MITINDQLSQSHMTLNTFDSPQQALHYINEVYQPEPFYDRYQNMNEDKTRSRVFFKTNIVDTHYEIYRPQRFEEISTVVIDFLPISDQSNEPLEMTGLDFFDKIKNPHVQKILLIREEDQELAQDALNNGLIDDFICKDEIDWLEQFYEKIQDSQWRYFNKLSEIFFEKVRSGTAHEYALNDPNFQNLFKSILSNYGFTEAYLCETTGSYLFLDGQAQDHGLVVNLADQLDSWVRNGQAKGINMPLLKELKDRKKMMCYHTEADGVEPDKSHWDLYAHPVKTIKGKSSTYYYAFAPNMYDIDVERVLPFEEYRENHQRKMGRIH